MTASACFRTAAAALLSAILLAVPSAASAFDLGALTAGGSNQTEYKVATEDGQEILLEWLDLDVTAGDLAGGIRYEAFQPPQKDDPLGDRVREGVAFRYVEATREWGRLRAGNHYALFGRGLSLNLFEDRDVRIDNNLDGILFDGSAGPVEWTLLSGRARVTSNERWPADDSRHERLDLLHAGDVVFRPVDQVLVGVSGVRTRYPAAGTEERRDLVTGRAEVSAGPVSIYAEHGTLDGAAGAADGEGTYVSANAATSGIGFTAEYKNYDRFALKTFDGRINLNNPPALSKEQSYTLMNRDPHSLDVNDERGYQLELTAVPRHGATVTANRSRNERHNGLVWYEEYFLDLRQDFEAELGVSTASVLLDYRGVGEGKFHTTVIGDLTWLFSDIYSLRVEAGHQHTENVAIGSFDTELVVLEFAQSPALVVGTSIEWNNKSEAQSVGQDKVYAMGTISRVLMGDADLTLAAGSRQAGYYCVGGRCRYEPAFKGVESKFLVRF